MLAVNVERACKWKSLAVVARFRIVVQFVISLHLHLKLEGTHH